MSSIANEMPEILVTVPKTGDVTVNSGGVVVVVVVIAFY